MTRAQQFALIRRVSAHQRQVSLLCGCGAPLPCRRCARRARLSRECFGGKREAVLRRDGRQCCGCGSFRSIVVHHRRPGVHTAPRLVTLCRACHVRVHSVRWPSAHFPVFLLELWRELHPRWPENRRLAFLEGAQASRPDRGQADLFAA